MSHAKFLANIQRELLTKASQGQHTRGVSPNQEQEAIPLSNVLCIGVNDAMMRIRLSILGAAGHSVTQATDLRRVIAACDSNQFAVAVLGQLLGHPEKLRITDVVRKHCPGAKILELYTSMTPEIPKEVDAHLCVNIDNLAEELVGAVNRLSAQRPRKQERGA